MRGAERTFAAIAECWPEAPIYTLLYDPRGRRAASPIARYTPPTCRASVSGRGGSVPAAAFPRATRSLRLDGHDSWSRAAAPSPTGVEAPGALHVCYCHTPFRYAWFERERALAGCAPPGAPALDRTLRRVREADSPAARKVTHYVANSAITRERIAADYGDEAEIVHPPVEVERFSPGEPAEDLLPVVAELVRHKRVESALEAARRAGVAIKVVGDGPRTRAPARRATADRRGRPSSSVSVDDVGLADLYSRALALVLPNVEEFGIAAVEAQAAGRPVVAVGQGGVRETVLDGVTGVLVDGEDAAALAEPLADNGLDRFDPAAIKAHSERFGAASFRRSFKTLVERYRTEHEALG